MILLSELMSSQNMNMNLTKIGKIGKCVSLVENLDEVNIKE